jgi:hypothetical protein
MKRQDGHDAKGERAAPRRFADRKPLIGADARPGSGAGARTRDKSRDKSAGSDGASANALAIRKALSGRDDGDEPRGKSSRPAGKPSTGKPGGRTTRPMKPR